MGDDIEFNYSLDGLFNNVYVVQTSHAAYDLMTGPTVKLDDGVMTVYVIQGATRLDLLKMMLDMETGKHADHPMVQSFRCTSYCLEPFDVPPPPNNDASDALAAEDERTAAEAINMGADSEKSDNEKSKPAGKGGIFSLDGELVTYGPICGTVMPGAAMIMSTYKP
jgi:hypothetical protein